MLDGPICQLIASRGSLPCRWHLCMGSWGAVSLGQQPLEAISIGDAHSRGESRLWKYYSREMVLPSKRIFYRQNGKAIVLGKTHICRTAGSTFVPSEGHVEPSEPQPGPPKRESTQNKHQTSLQTNTRGPAHPNNHSTS